MKWENSKLSQIGSRSARYCCALFLVFSLLCFSLAPAFSQVQEMPAEPNAAPLSQPSPPPSSQDQPLVLRLAARLEAWDNWYSRWEIWNKADKNWHQAVLTWWQETRPLLQKQDERLAALESEIAAIRLENSLLRQQIRDTAATPWLTGAGGLAAGLIAGFVAGMQAGK